MAEREVSKERNHWRDEEFSARHRLWGFDCPAMDIDGIAAVPGLAEGWVEYDNFVPVGLFELKKWPAEIRSSSAQVRVLQTLANMANLPAYGVRYWFSDDRQDWRFQVTPLNPVAVKDFGPGDKSCGERSFVYWLHSLRGRSAPKPLLRRFRDVPPPDKIW